MTEVKTLAIHPLIFHFRFSSCQPPLREICVCSNKRSSINQTSKEKEKKSFVGFLNRTLPSSSLPKLLFVGVKSASEPILRHRPRRAQLHFLNENTPSCALIAFPFWSTSPLVVFCAKLHCSFSSVPAIPGPVFSLPARLVHPKAESTVVATHSPV